MPNANANAQCQCQCTIEMGDNMINSWALRAGMMAALTCAASIAVGQTHGVSPADMPGRWTGYGQSAVNGQLSQPYFDIGLNRNRRLHGTVYINPCFFPTEFTLSADGNIEGKGRDGDGDFIWFRGAARAEGDGSVRVASLLYVVVGPDFGFDLGATVFVQLPGGLGWDRIGGANVTGMWDGSYAGSGRTGGGAIAMDLANGLLGRDQQSTALSGDATFAGLFGGDEPGLFRMIGAAWPPQPQHSVPIALLGLHQPRDPNAPAPIAILIGLIQPTGADRPATIHGGYFVYGSVFDAFAAIALGENTAFDAGAFIISSHL
jgi:hypothetical protein